MFSSTAPSSTPVKVTTKRSQIRDEIISSEETYVKELRTLVMVFLRPLEKWVAEGMNGLAIPAGNVLDIFSNAEEVLAFNEQILRDLTGRNEGGVVGGRRKGIGATFRRQPLDMFKPYSVYVKKYPQALKSLEVCEGNSSFKAFVRACEHQEACHGLDLRAYLIQPVQRVPRYRLLIIELLKHTRESHPDWVDLNAALANVSSTAAKLNQGARDQERFVRALEIQNEFREHFLKPSSHLVKEGDLLKVCNGGPRRYKFVLFSDMLVYGTETMRAKLQRDHRKYKAWLDAFAESFAEINEKCHQQQNSDSPQPQQQPQQQPRNGDGGGPSSPTSETSSSRRVSENEWMLEVGNTGNDFGDSSRAGDAIGRAGEDNAPVSPPTKIRPRSIAFPTGAGAAMAQTVTASMMSVTGRWSLAGGGGGDGGGVRNSLASHATSGGSSSSPSVRSSFSRRPIHCVQVWVPIQGRTEMQEISLQGLPPASTSGVFKVHQTDTNNFASSSSSTNHRSRPHSNKLLATAPASISSLSYPRSDVSSSHQRSRTPSPEQRQGGVAMFIMEGGGGGGAAEAIVGGGGGGSEVALNGGGGTVNASENTPTTGSAGHVERRGAGLRAMRSQQAAAEMLSLPFSDDDFEDENNTDSDSDASKAFERSIEGSRTSWGVVGNSGNVRKMLAKFECEKNQGDHGTAEEEEDERSSGSSNIEKEYFNPMLHYGDPFCARNACIGDEQPGASATMATGAGGGVGGGAGSVEDSLHTVNAAAAAADADSAQAKAKKEGGRASRFLRQSRSWAVGTESSENEKALVG
eukprot:g13359.t1